MPIVTLVTVLQQKDHKENYRFILT